MLRRTLTSVAAVAATAGSLVGMAVAKDGYGVRVYNAKTLETKVYEPTKGMSYTVGSNRLVGYFEAAEGKCALTLMLFKQNGPDGSPDMSAARVKVSIRPGENARIDSAEGEAVELNCDNNAETITAAHFDKNTRSH